MTSNRETTRMKSLLVLVVSLMLLAIACDVRETVYVDGQDITPPPVPSGVRSITGDGVVWVHWNEITGVDDLEGFKIFRSIDNNIFNRIATVSAAVSSYADYNVINGQTYFYGVSSFDFDGNESNESFDYVIVFDTPRPEGIATIFNSADPGYTDISGFDFSSETRVLWSSPDCDINLEYDDTPGITSFYIWLGPHGLAIQDMGYTSGFDDISYAPPAGWSGMEYVEAIEGHTYVLLTMDNHYAKVRISSFSGVPAYSMTFEWGYQTDTGNRELKIDPSTLGIDISEAGQ